MHQNTPFFIYETHQPWCPHLAQTRGPVFFLFLMWQPDRQQWLTVNNAKIHYNQVFSSFAFIFSFGYMQLTQMTISQSAYIMHFISYRGEC